jgi:hypothetical protein
MKLTFIKIMFLLILITVNRAFADSTIEAQQASGDDPWSKTYVFQFEHDTFYVPAVWIADSHETIPEINQLHKPPDGAVIQVKTEIGFNPLAPDYIFGFSDTLEDMRKIKNPRLVAGPSFLAEIQLNNFYGDKGYISKTFPKGFWDKMKLDGSGPGKDCCVFTISCKAKTFKTTELGGSYCFADRAAYDNIYIRYVWDGRYVDPASWEYQDRRVQQLLDWLKTPPNQRPKFLPDLPPKDKP